MPESTGNLPGYAAPGGDTGPLVVSAFTGLVAPSTTVPFPNGATVPGNLVSDSTINTESQWSAYSANAIIGSGDLTYPGNALNGIYFTFVTHGPFNAAAVGGLAGETSFHLIQCSGILDPGSGAYEVVIKYRGRGSTWVPGLDPSFNFRLYGYDSGLPISPWSTGHRLVGSNNQPPGIGAYYSCLTVDGELTLTSTVDLSIDGIFYLLIAGDSLEQAGIYTSQEIFFTALTVSSTTTQSFNVDGAFDDKRRKFSRSPTNYTP